MILVCNVLIIHNIPASKWLERGQFFQLQYLYKEYLITQIYDLIFIFKMGNFLLHKYIQN